MNTVEYGPLREQTMLTAGLDYYKPTMTQFIYEHEPDAEATFTFKNRGNQRLLDYINPDLLQERFDTIRQQGFDDQEVAYLATVTNAAGERLFNDAYLEHISHAPLPDVAVTVEHDDIAIRTTGDWSMVSFWETVVMSEVNEQYFEGYMRTHGINPYDLYEAADEKLSEKIAFLQENPQISVAEFGTRRRFSLRWQKHVIDRLQTECPNNLLGTSNVAFAQTMGLKPIGTFAHELPMGYAGLADARGQDIRASHGTMLDDWYDFYGDELAIALSDTFGTDFFLEDFTPERTAKYRGTRHDSGPPIAYGEKMIAHYQANDIDPTTKVTLFSDGLNMQKAAEISDKFAERLTSPFGIGTDLTNDFPVRALNVVMKLTHIKDTQTGQEADTVKLSDNPGKHTGPEALVARYQAIFNLRKESHYERALATTQC